MLRHIGIIQACFQSPRFRWNATRQLGGRSLLEWVIRRVTDSICLDGVIVVMECEPDDFQTASRMVPSDVPVFQAEGNDALAHCTKALEKYQAEGIVRVRGDNIFIDPALIDRVVIAAESKPDCDYVGYSSHDGSPATLSPANVYAEWFRASALRKADRLARDEFDRENITSYFHAHPEKFELRLMSAPVEIDREDVRLTVDIEEDWEHVMAIFEALGPEHLDWHGIANLLDHQPALRNRMATLNRAHAHA
jgi:spore coat polysaccharide biosynthesis protein SpsF